MKKFYRTKLNQDGVVSLISILLFTLIITVLTLAYLQSAIRQQRNALNYDLSTRAYYAAEAGAQDAIRGLQTNPADKTACAPFIGGDPNGTVGESAFNLSYSCQLVTLNPSQITGELLAGETAMIRLDPSTLPAPAGPYRMYVRWSLRSAEVRAPRSTTDPIFPPNDNWSEGDVPVHSLLRVGVISAPRANPTRDNIKQRVIFLNPTNQASVNNDSSLGDAGYPVLTVANDDILPQQENLVNNAACFSSNGATRADFEGYACKRTVLLRGYDLNSQTIYVRLGALYKNTEFSITLVPQPLGSRTPILMQNNQAVIDVTGSANGEVFRRVQQRVSLGGYVRESGTDAALIAGEGICKLFSITNDPSGYDEGCDPLGP